MKEQVRINTQFGFSLVEALVALSIATVLTTYGMVSFVQLLNQEDQQLNDQINQRSDELIASNSMWRDMAGITLSMNNILQKDDNGRGFFDFFPDVPDEAIIGVKTRKLTLGAGGVSELYFITSKEKDDITYLYDPIKAYAYGAYSTPAKAVTFNYVGLNNGKYFEKIANGKWEAGRQFLFYIPRNYRTPKKLTGFRKFPPQWLIFTGAIAGGDISHFDVGGHIRTVHPSDAGVTIDTMDKFFRYLPVAGEGAPEVFFREIRVLRYSMVPDDKNPSAKMLIRQSWTKTDGLGTNYDILAKGLNNVVLTRPTISSPNIQVKYNFIN